MARMLPPFVPESTQSAAERKLFVVMRDELSDDWTVLHSLGTTLHDRKPWAEIDFVLVGPEGVFCLEVKGGRVARRDGRWEFIDRIGAVSTKREGPFEQVGPAAAQIRNYLVDRLPEARSAIIGYGVATPDIVFDVAGPDVEPEVVFDERDSARPFDEYVSRLSKYWTTRLGRRGSMTPDLRGRITALLRPDFDLQPSLRGRLRDVQRELIRLTEEQYRVLDGLTENPRVVIRGSAGTGKTLLAVEEARRQRALGNRVLLCCFNRMLAARLSELEDLDGVDVYHFHGLLSDLIDRAGLRDRLPDATPDELFRVFMPSVALEAVFGMDDFGAYDVLIVDEGQDLLLADYVDVFDAVLDRGWDKGRWRVFLDPHQDLYGARSKRGSDRLQHPDTTLFRLSVNCRNTRPIATTSALMGAANPADVMETSGPEVEWIWYRDARHQRRELGRRLAKIISSDGVAPSSIVVLTRRRLENSGLADGLIDCLLQLAPVRKAGDRTIPHSTITAFKGLEADVVVLADVGQLSSPEAQLENYVASSRARGLLIVALNETLRDDFGHLARKLGERVRVGVAASDPSVTK